MKIYDIETMEAFMKKEKTSLLSPLNPFFNGI
jgi:hypothetical protein